MARPKLPSRDIVVMAKTAAATASNAEIFTSLSAHWKRLGAGPRRGPEGG